MLSAKARSAAANPIGGWIKTSHLHSFDCKASPPAPPPGFIAADGVAGGGIQNYTS